LTNWCDVPQESIWLFTIRITQPEAEALARGDVPPLVQNTVISLLIDTETPPGAAIDAMARRRKQKVTR
jgi:hypothetical protein